MSTGQSAAGQVISETARQEGGPYKGSDAAQMQSQVTKQQNFEQAAQQVGSRMQADPSSVSQEDASLMQSREQKLMPGGVRPPSDSISAEAQRMATANEQGRPTGTVNVNGANTGNAGLAPQEQSRIGREQNFQEAVDAIKPKIENDPSSVTTEDANLLHSREERAHGKSVPASQGGISATAHKLAAQNEGQTA